ncbi:MAG: hypothetical protein ABJJ44_00315 [Paraglaciecola sp.]
MSALIILLVTFVTIESMAAISPSYNSDIGVTINDSELNTFVFANSNIAQSEIVTLQCCRDDRNISYINIKIQNYSESDLWVSTTHIPNSVISSNEIREKRIPAKEELEVALFYKPEYDQTSFNESYIEHIDFEFKNTNTQREFNIPSTSNMIRVNLTTNFDIDCSSYKADILGSWYSTAIGEEGYQELELFENGVGYYKADNTPITWSIVATDSAISGGNYTAGCVLEIAETKKDILKELPRTSLQQSTNEFTVYSDLNTPILHYTH